MKKVNEIFYSLQGEGYYTGTPAVFVRFSGCNLHCAFCDTDHTAGVRMSDEEIIDAVRTYPARHVVITGGEPGLQLTDELVAKLHDAGCYVQIETNGTVPIPSAIDWVTCSPKEGGRVVLSRIHELKVVYTSQDMLPYEELHADVCFLQPCSCRNTGEVIRYILQHPRWRLSLQTHKMLDIR